jgi:ubiquinone/menaquinone biosynthesis C-methylase UbiE
VNQTIKMKGNFDGAAKLFDFIRSGDSRRWGGVQKKFFSQLQGKVLYVGIGTGQEIVNFPPGLDIVAIDISAEMLKRAQERISAYPGNMTSLIMDAHNTTFEDNSFDMVLTVCVLCTVDKPVQVLEELKRVLKPGGKLVSFEHVQSRNPLFAWPLFMMNFLSLKLTGTSLIRHTAKNIRLAGFDLITEANVYLDIVKMFTSRKPGN